jgi:hypothetical protein
VGNIGVFLLLFAIVLLVADTLMILWYFGNGQEYDPVPTWAWLIPGGFVYWLLRR